MKTIASYVVVLCVLFCVPLLSLEIASLDEARALSAEQGKPILLEFVHED